MSKNEERECVFCEKVRDRSAEPVSPAIYAFEPLNPVVPGHRLFIPAEHVAGADTYPRLTGMTFAAAATHAAQKGGDFNLIVNGGRDRGADRLPPARALRAAPSGRWPADAVGRRTRMSKNEELARKVRGLVHKQELDATIGRKWTVDEFVEAVVAAALEAQDARIEELEAELASLEENRHVAAQLSHQYRNRAERAEQERDAAVKELRDRELHHFEEEQKSAGLAAVIEAAKIAIGTENAWDGHARADQLDNTRRILVTADTFNLSAYTTRIREEAVGKDEA